jgi:hypothetical protein
MDLATIKMGLDLAKAVKDLMPKGGRDDNTQALKQEISAALRTLYFTPRGGTALLKKIDEGEKVSREEVSAALIHFNDGEPKVERAAANLLFERLSREFGLSLRTIQTLEMVRYGKISLRRKIQNEINYYGVGRTRPNKEAVKLLLADIEKLNAMILDVEEAVSTTGNAR